MRNGETSNSPRIYSKCKNKQQLIETIFGQGCADTFPLEWGTNGTREGRMEEHTCVTSARPVGYKLSTVKGCFCTIKLTDANRHSRTAYFPMLFAHRIVLAAILSAAMGMAVPQITITCSNGFDPVCISSYSSRQLCHFMF